MAVTPLLILPLIGGYAFSTTWYASLYRAAREEGHRLYFRAAFYGAFLFVCAFELHTIMYSCTEWYKHLLQLLSTALEVNADSPPEIWGKESRIAILCLSLPLGPILAHLINHLFMKRFKNEFGIGWAQNLIIERSIGNNDFELLVYASLTRFIPILFTLDGGKVYVGWAVSTPNPAHVRKSVRILPILSGYRDEQQTAIFTTSYEKLLDAIIDENDDEVDHLSHSDLEVVIPTSQIVSGHLFDLTAYTKFFDDQRENSENN